MRFRTKRLDARQATPVLARAFGDGVALTALAEEIKKDEEAAAAATPEADKPPAEVPKVKWINVAIEGEYAGHPDGEFTLDRKTFQGFVDELHRDPRYKAGADGVGVAKTIPFDFEHASEMDPREGSIAQSGAPAPAWVYDLQIRDGEDGKAQLWALVWLGEKIRAYIKNEEYRHVSIAFSLEAKDPKSAAVVGPRISSIAFTNHPFLRDTLPLAASNRGLRQAEPATSLRWYDAAGSVEDGLKYTRQCLGLGPTADSAEIKAEIAKLAAIAADPEAAKATNPGVNVGEVFGDLRVIWGLTLTATVADVVAEIDKGVAAMGVAVAAQSATAAAVSNAAAAAPPLVPAPNQLSSQPSPESGASQENAIMGLSATNVAIVKCLRANKYRTERMLADDADVEGAVEDMTKDIAKLNAVLSALGVENAEAALAAIPSLKNALTQLSQVQAQLNEALAMQAEAEVGAAAADVSAAVAAKNWDPSTGDALKVQRDSMIAAEVALAEAAAKAASPNGSASPKQLFDARAAGRRKFLSQYGVAPEAQEKLLKNIAVAAGTQIPVPEMHALRSGGVTVAPTVLTARTQIDLRGVEGRNTFERLCSYVKAQKGNENLDWNALCRKASELGRDPKFEIVDPAKSSAA